MDNKVGNFFEAHIEKIVLAVAGLVCVWLLLSRVVLSPNYVEYDNKKFSCEAIDDHIRQQATKLEDKLNEKPTPKEAYKSRAGEFSAIVETALGNVASIELPIPANAEELGVQALYIVPEISGVEEVAVEHFRAVAYLPIMEVDEENGYTQNDSEMGDIDFVTVEGKFDAAGLYESFGESFDSDLVRMDWRDPCLAKPVFAAVELQRQESVDGVMWSDWQRIPRSRIEARSKMFEVIEKVEDLPPGGVRVRMIQYNDGEARRDLLQAESYKIASAEESWLPPSLHEKFLKSERDLALQERREQRESELEDIDRSRSRSRTGRQRSRGGSSGIDSMMTGGATSRSRSRRDRDSERSRSRSELEDEDDKRERKRPEEVDAFEEFESIQLTEDTDLSDLEEPLLFWAHDDTVQPGKSYRYRIRLGVFNPIAGTDQFREQDVSKKNDVILWSDYSDITKTVDIPKLMYFFPRDLQETSKSVTVHVCSYKMGYWHSKDFTVKQGEIIGKLSDYEPSEDEEDSAELVMPDTIDYRTNAMLVDVVAVRDWAGTKNLYERYYYDLLYSYDGMVFEHIPVKQSYWSKGLQAKFNEIKRLEKMPKQAFEGWQESRKSQQSSESKQTLRQ